MNTLLVVNSSGRVTRSITRHLAQRFVDQWKNEAPDVEIIERDVGVQAPPMIDEAWIASAFSKSDEQDEAMREALSWSETLIGEVERADALVLGVPMYNFGMPAAMKAWLDQLVRVGRTFNFTGNELDPYRALLRSKPVVLIVSTGTSGYEPGGHSEAYNFLEPHLRAVLAFIGLDDVTVINVGFEEQQDGQFVRSLKAAELAVDEKVAELLTTSELLAKA